MKRYLSLLLVLALICSLMPPSIPCASATTCNPIDSYSVSFNTNSIVEYVTTSINGTLVSVTRTTYNNNTAVVTVVENGNSSTFSCSVDYNTLLQNMSRQQTPNTTGFENRRAGYVYTPMKTEVFTDYYTPDNKGWATFLGAFATILGKYHFTLGAITAIAAMAFSNSSSDIPIKLVTTMDWYFKTLDGEFISYYCEYSTKTYVQKDTGVWEYIGTETGTMESLTVW